MESRQDMEVEEMAMGTAEREELAKLQNPKLGYPRVGFPRTELNPIAIFHTEDENNPNWDNYTESQIAMHECTVEFSPTHTTLAQQCHSIGRQHRAYAMTQATT